MPFEHSKKRIASELGLICAVVALALGLGWAVLRWVIDVSVERVPTSVDRSLGDALAAALNRAERSCASTEPTASVAALAKALASEANLDGEVDARVLKDDQVNAFALPGGHVYVLAGLLAKAQSVDEVAGVLGHELGHVALRHHLRSAVRDFGVATAATAVLGSVDSLTAMVIGGSNALLSRAFSREQEEAADAYGVRLMVRFGYDPHALGRLLERMEDPVAVPSLLRTHPSSPDRRRKLDRLADAFPPSSTRSKPAATLEGLHSACAQTP